MEVAEAIKTMDMSLPSYGTISAPKAGGESLLIPEEKQKQEGSVLPAKKTKSFIPSMEPSKREIKKAEAKKTAAKKDIIDNEDDNDVSYKNEKIKLLDMTMPSYSDTTATPKKSAFRL